MSLVKTEPPVPIVAKRIVGGASSAFSEGVPAAVGPRALSRAKRRGETHRQRRIERRPGNGLPNDGTNERKSICMIHARERGRLKGGPGGRGHAGVGIRNGERQQRGRENREPLFSLRAPFCREPRGRRELYARSTHVILYKRTRRGILTMLPPRSLDQSCPEAHARYEASPRGHSRVSSRF